MLLAAVAAACQEGTDIPGVTYQVDSFTGTKEDVLDGGNQEVKIEFVDGWRHGKYSQAYKEGGISVEGQYAHGKRHGTWIGTWATGGRQSITEYRHDVIVSTKEWYEDGALRVETCPVGSDKGAVRWVFYYPEGGKLCEGLCDREGNRRGVWVYWTEAGQVEKTVDHR